MLNNPMQISLEYVRLLVITIGLIPAVSIAVDILLWWYHHNVNACHTEIILNVLRAVLYPLTIYCIFMGQNIGDVGIWGESATLVPVDYAGSVPLLLVEGIGGGYGVSKKVVSWYFNRRNVNN